MLSVQGREFGRERGFTLIELLVVIAIIAILAAILFPVFARARENARRSSCQSNVKQILLGVLQYSQDYDEKYPGNRSLGSGITASGNTPSVPRNWYTMIQPYLKSTQIYQCPSDSSTVPANYTGPNDYHVSYGVNGNFGNLSDTPGPLPPSLAQLETPAATVYLTDGGLQSDNDQGIKENPRAEKHGGERILTLANNAFAAAPPNASPTVPTAACSASNCDNNFAPNPRHLETAVVGFADGHVKSMRPANFYGGNGPTTANTPQANPYFNCLRLFSQPAYAGDTSRNAGCPGA